VLAQKLLFANIAAGTSLPTFPATSIRPQGVRPIHKAIKKSPRFCSVCHLRWFFISDVTTELDGARAADIRTLLCVRPTNLPQRPGKHRLIRTLDEVFPYRLRFKKLSW